MKMPTMKQIRETDPQELELTVRMANAFSKYGLNTVGEILDLGKEGFLAIPKLNLASWSHWQTLIGELVTGDTDLDFS